MPPPHGIHAPRRASPGTCPSVPRILFKNVQVLLGRELDPLRARSGPRGSGTSGLCHRCCLGRRAVAAWLPRSLRPPQGVIWELVESHFPESERGGIGCTLAVCQYVSHTDVSTCLQLIPAERGAGECSCSLPPRSSHTSG